jgi:hypothetical protein
MRLHKLSSTVVAATMLVLGIVLAYSPATSQAALVSVYTFDDSANLGANAVTSAQAGAAAAGAIPTKPIPAAHGSGDVFYIITEGAGLGDNVRRVPCTGHETVLDAVSEVNGLSQISGSKMWIARPSSSNGDKSDILRVDWEAVSRKGINATNYKLMPGDRLVIGADPVIARNSAFATRMLSLERTMGVVSLTASTLSALDGLSANHEVLKELVRKGVFSDDEELNNLLLEAMRRPDQK